MVIRHLEMALDALKQEVPNIELAKWELETAMALLNQEPFDCTYRSPNMDKLLKEFGW